MSSEADWNWRQSDYLMLILIPSAPGNINQRNAIRQTWLNAKYQMAERRYPGPEMFVPSFDYDGLLTHESVEEQMRQLKVFSIWNENLKADNFEQLPAQIKHVFVMGSSHLEEATKMALEKEELEFRDLLLLPDLVDRYANLTRKMLTAFKAAEKRWEFDYLLKADDDTYVNLSILAEDLYHYHQNLRLNRQREELLPQLYWGFFNGRAQIKTSGKWKESNYNLCDRFLPYALGGGYVLSRGLIKFLAINSHRLMHYRSEDVSVGTWLMAQKHIHRRHDVRFDTGYMPRKCQSYHLVLHKRTIEDMYKLWNGVSCSQLQSSVQYHTKPKEYYYDWTQPPSKCCDNVLN